MILVCLLALAVNLFLIRLFQDTHVPLFLDTIGTVAVAFAFGLVPALAVAVLTWFLYGMLFQLGTLHPFVFVAIAEVLLVSRLKPPASESLSWMQNSAIPERKTTYVAIVSAQLFVLYIVCAIAASTLGGAIAFLHYTVWGRDTPSFYIVVNAFRWNFLQGGNPVFLADTLSRVQVNIVSRFIVIFGGYFISLGIKAFARTPPI